jgi:catechol-2,3-dioxygenase
VSVQSTPRAASAVTGTDLAGVTVRDLQTALVFYRDTLGMPPSVVSENGSESGSRRKAKAWSRASA